MLIQMALASVMLAAADTGFVPVSFKDASKVKSWDAWNDHRKAEGDPRWPGGKEKRCVTLEKIRKMNSGLEPLGWLEKRSSRDIGGSPWSIGCETLDRDYADWDQYRHFLGDLGVKRGRLFSGWAKTEQEKGKYDFSWLDSQVRGMAAMGVKPWICISYGNPVWGSDFRLGMRVKQITGSREALDAWIRYTKALVDRYKDVVTEWEIWNEPFHQAEEYALMICETAKAIKEVQPEAVCIVTAITWDSDMQKNDYRIVLDVLKERKALNLVKWWSYHPYVPIPESCYESKALPLRALVKSYSADYDILQGEAGCPSQLEYAHALRNVEWTEYAQAKWDLRRSMGDFARGIPSNLFTFIDLQYTFMLQSFGLIRSNTLKQPVYRRPSYFAMQNVYSFFDEDVRPLDIATHTVNGKELSVLRAERQSKPIFVVWFSGERPGDSLEYETADLSQLVTLPGWEGDEGPVWVDFMRGAVGKLTDMKKVPVWDSPVMIAPSSQVPRQADR